MRPTYWRYCYMTDLFGVWLFDHWGLPFAAHHCAMEVLAMEACT